MIDRSKRITNENITELKKDEVFVFGSNEAGKHGAGAALLAKQKFGAVEGVGFGPQGQTFGIPTKDWHIDKMPADIIECYVGRFIDYAHLNPQKQFLVTQVGCGLAGHKPEDIGKFFAPCEFMDNVHLPQVFWDAIDKVYREEMVKDMQIVNDGEKNEFSDV